MARRRSELDEVVVVDHPAVHVLRTEEELREAVARAAWFDERTAAALRSRSKHYHSLFTQPFGPELREQAGRFRGGPLQNGTTSIGESEEHELRGEAQECH